MTAGSTDQQPDAAAQPEYTPAVSVRESLGSRDHIISMIDGKPYRTLKRHLATNGLTPNEYRSRYDLNADYPMVAPAYVDDAGATPANQPRARKSVTEAKVAAKKHLEG